MFVKEKKTMQQCGLKIIPLYGRFAIIGYYLQTQHNYKGLARDGIQSVQDGSDLPDHLRVDQLELNILLDGIRDIRDIRDLAYRTCSGYWEGG